MLSEKMKIYLIICLGFYHLDQVTSLPDEYKTETRGYGNTHETVMRPRCDFPTVMAVKDMFVTSKKKSLGCPAFIQASTVYDPVCTQVQDGDCTLQFDLTKREPYLECTGNIECDVGTDWQQVLGTCGSSYMESSHIMSMQYNCIPSADILNFNVVASKTGVIEAYISNDGFPNAMTSSSHGTCVITSCSTGIVVGLIDLRLSSSGGICQQSLIVTDGGTTKVFDCNDNNSLQYRQRYTSVTSSIYVTLTVASSTPESFAWIDASGDRMDVYCGVTEAFTPPSELDCTTTTGTTTESESQTTPTTTTPVPSNNAAHSTTVTTDITPTQPTSTGQPAMEDSQSTFILSVVGVVVGVLNTALLIAVMIKTFCPKKETGKVGQAPQGGQLHSQHQDTASAPNGKPADSTFCSVKLKKDYTGPKPDID